MNPLYLLTLAQALAACGSMTVVLVGGILGVTLAPTPALATLAPALAIVGLAATTIPAAMAMQRWGRRPVLVAAAVFASLAACVAALGVARDSFVLLCLGCLGVGMHNAFVQQYRFAATEWVPASEAGRAVSTIMLGTLAAAFLSREATLASENWWPGHQYAGSFLALALLFLGTAALLLGLPRTEPARAAVHDEPVRTLRELWAQPALRVAVLGSITAWVAMSFIMTATPVSMHSVDGHDFLATTGVIQAHLLGMYVPALFSAYVLRWLGVRRMLFSGCALMAACIGIAATGHHAVLHYGWALVLLGIGWNWMFVASTALLTDTYRPAERFKVQALNEFTTFGAQAASSLFAAGVLFAAGWERLNLMMVPLLCVLLVVVARTPLATNTSAANPEPTNR
jgi:MFS family permease